jgi:hypothetical protein
VISSTVARLPTGGHAHRRRGSRRHCFPFAWTWSAPRSTTDVGLLSLARCGAGESEEGEMRIGALGFA